MGQNHICGIDCKLVAREDGGFTHVMYPSDPTTAAGRYQYDRNREIYTMGKGARAAMRATGQQDTRTNREWNYARTLYRELYVGPAWSEDETREKHAEYQDLADKAFGPGRRPFTKHSIRSLTRMGQQSRATAWMEGVIY